MKPTAKLALDTLGGIGITALFGAAIALLVVLFGEVDAALIGQVFLSAFGSIGVIFTAVWLLGYAIVEQLTDRSLSE